MVANGIITAGRQHCLKVLRSEVNFPRQTDRERERGETVADAGNVCRADTISAVNIADT